jgi:peptidoglycan hydrolase-like protein with peptidoglycan-binding domain
MVTSRRPFIALGVAILVLAACGSDKNTSKGATTTTNASTVTSLGTSTSTTALGGSITVPPVTIATQTTAAPGVTTVTTAGGTSVTSTTVKGRTVTSPSDNVKLGDKGDGVKKIQFALKAAGYKVTVDGDFGNQTDAAVRQFQKKNNLKVDGIVGKITWGKLSAASNATGATTTTTK